MPLLPLATAAPFLPSLSGDVAGFRCSITRDARRTEGNDTRCKRIGTFARDHSRARSPFADVRLRNAAGRYCAVCVAGGTSRPARRYLHARLRGVGIRAVTGVGAKRLRASEREREEGGEDGWEGVEQTWDIEGGKSESVVLGK